MYMFKHMDGALPDSRVLASKQLMMKKKTMMSRRTISNVKAF